MHRRVEGRGAVTAELTQQVALGDDTDRAVGVERIDVQRTDLGVDHLFQRLVQCDIGIDEQRRTAHQVAQAVAIRKAVDARQHRARAPRLVDVEPTDSTFLGGGFAETFAGPFEFGQGANAGLAQARDQRDEDFSGGDRIAERAVALVNFDPGPAGDRVERKIRQVGRQQVDQEADVETTRRSPAEPGDFALALEHRQIEAARVAD